MSVIDSDCSFNKNDSVNDSREIVIRLFK